jgi:hypothetical protein
VFLLFSRLHTANPYRLRGSAIEIHAGTSNPSIGCTRNSVSDSWFLPKNLISHFSPFLQAACSGPFRETQEGRIELPDDDPTVFGLFVEWMYYGSYDILPPTTYSSTDAKCWVLGDKLLCGEFKNYALGRLYRRHVSTYFGLPVSCEEVQYAWENTASDAKLRQFYGDFVVQNFSHPRKLLGSGGDWDALLQSHSELRMLLLENFRKGRSLRTLVKDEREYLELENSNLSLILDLATRAGPLSIRGKGEEV